METKESGRKGRVYYVRGSGYSPVPEARIHEIPRMRKEVHETDLKMRLATTWMHRRA